MTKDAFDAAIALLDAEDAVQRAQAAERLAPYRVTNAVLMAAGYGSRLAPITDHTPKGLLRVRGEVLVERQIAQLRAAGIADIFLVVGYLKEQFSYLASDPHIHLVDNEDYHCCNNTSSIFRVLDVLDNTYICSADNYFTENVFTPYVYRSYYASVYGDAPSEEYYLSVDDDGRITDVQIGGAHGWYMLGQAYFSRAFSARFAALLREAYEQDPSVRGLLWEQFYMRHIEELALERREYADGIIYEFDTLADIQAFDESFPVQDYIN